MKYDSREISKRAAKTTMRRCSAGLTATCLADVGFFANVVGITIGVVVDVPNQLNEILSFRCL